MVIIESVEVEPLPSKYYETELHVKARNGYCNSTIRISISGYSYPPSVREVNRGWDAEHGMDHVEGEIQYKIALAIAEALEDKSW